MHDGSAVLLNLGDPGRFDFARREDRVRFVDATHEGPWELPVLGRVPAPSAVLIRPDGHVAWVGDEPEPSLHEALSYWFGSRTPRTE
jgi:hypothetical protein